MEYQTLRSTWKSTLRSQTMPVCRDHSGPGPRHLQYSPERVLNMKNLMVRPWARSLWRDTFPLWNRGDGLRSTEEEHITFSSFRGEGPSYNAADCITKMAIFLLNIISISVDTLTQKSLIRGHSKIQLKHESSVVLHLTQYFESKGLNVLGFTGSYEACV